MIKVFDNLRGEFRGKPSLYTCTDPDDRSTWTLLHEGHNVVCTGMYDSMQNLLLRNFTDWMASEVSVGFGGDYNQPADPVASPPADTSARVPALFADTYVRKPMQSIPILQVTDPATPSELHAKYVAMVDPDGFTTDTGDPLRPYINELGLMAANGTLLAHYITPLDGLVATRFTKTDLEWLVVEWDIEFIGA